MDRKEFLSQLGMGAAGLVLFGCMGGCEKDTVPAAPTAIVGTVVAVAAARVTTIEFTVAPVALSLIKMLPTVALLVLFAPAIKLSVDVPVPLVLVSEIQLLSVETVQVEVATLGVRVMLGPVPPIAAIDTALVESEYVTGAGLDAL